MGKILSIIYRSLAVELCNLQGLFVLVILSLILVVHYTLEQKDDLAFVHFHTLEIDSEFHIPDDQARHQINWHIEHEQTEKNRSFLYSSLGYS